MTDQIQAIRSMFDPFDGKFYANAIPSLDLNKVQAHSTTNNNTESKLESEITLNKGEIVSSLTWANYSSSHSKQQQKKKRKRSSLANGGDAGSLEDLVVAIGTTKGNILLFSPSQGSIVHTLSNVHSVSVTSMETLEGSVLWSCDYSGVISRYDLTTDKQKVEFNSPEKEVRLIKPLNESVSQGGDLLLASTNIQLVDSNSPKKIIKNYPGFVHPVGKIIQPTSRKDVFLASSQSDRNINVNSIENGNSVKILTGQSEIQDMILAQDDSALAAITDDGLVEIFLNPLEVANQNNGSSKSSRRKSGGSQSVSSNIQISIQRPRSSQQVRIDNLIFSKDYLILAWLENAGVPVFENFNWRESQTGLVELTRAHKTLSRAGKNDGKINGSDPAAAAPYNEANSIVSSGKDVKNLESDDDDDDEQEEGTLAERLDALEVDQSNNNKKPDNITNNTKSTNSNNNNNNNTLSKMELSTPGTFTTILSQALKTNDHALLESCLSNHDEKVIKVSIQRLDSTLAVKLLERLAEKISRNPSQAGQLNIWIKWVMISHGGYLVTIPNLLKTLSSLHSTLADRVSTLPRLLALQGRLEMLNSQMELRRDILESSSKKGGNNDDEDDDEDEEKAVEYIEDGAYIANGEEDIDSDEDDEGVYEEEDSDVEDGFIDLEAEDDDEPAGLDDEEEGNSDLEVGEPMSEEGDEEEEEKPASRPKKKTNGSIKSKK